MAKKKHIDILMKGTDTWNEWRERHHLEEVDLTDADLHGITLTGAYLWKANLTGANLTNANLFKADLSAANLSSTFLSNAHIREADLRNTNLYGANLQGANLFCSNFQYADLRRAKLVAANLERADFSFANLMGAELENADMKNTCLAYTIFGDTNLSYAKNLNLCQHRSKSIIDQLTLMKSGHLPEVFLRGCGLTEGFIKLIPTLFSSQEYYSCYISYSHKDKAFAHRIYNRLQTHGIRCWLDEKQLVPGDQILDQLSRGIGLWDKVLLCCSEHSCNSLWVDREITMALDKEGQLFSKYGRPVMVLIPLNLDNYLFGNKWKSGKRDLIRSRLAANFAGQKVGSAKFNTELQKVIKALRSDKGAREKPPKSKL
ncbi:MAG TPA: toll/interleukin-1 receptor domain-containing protein [Anaerolineales bacterium]|nr:toll/interleukin-1 receptor domain-containing protein [Anaerolineales bacterium]